MALKLDRLGLRTDVNVDAPWQIASTSNDSSARKFVAKDQVVNLPVGNNDVVANAEHIIEQAVKLSTVSAAVVIAAAKAREDLVVVREQLAEVKGQTKTDERQKVSSFSNNDVQIAQEVAAKGILSAISEHPESLQNRLGRSTRSMLSNSSRLFLPLQKKSEQGETSNVSIPVMRDVAVDMDPKKGVLDSFFCKIGFDLPAADVSSGKIKAVRVFRSTIMSPINMRTSGMISMLGIERLRSSQSRFRSKNQDSLSVIEKVLRESGVPNAVTSLIPVDPFTNVRKSSAVDPKDIARQFVPTRPNSDSLRADLASFVSATGNPIDKSVANDLNSLRNLQTNSSSSSALSRTRPAFVPIGKSSNFSPRQGSEQIRQARIEQGSDTSIVVNQNNSQDFVEIAFVSPDKIKGKMVGDFVEYTMEDAGISFGRGYRYFVVSVDENLNESIRSRIVEIVADGFRIPPFPSRFNGYLDAGFVSLAVQVDDQLVEKFEIYRKELGSHGQSKASIDVNVVSNAGGFTLAVEKRDIQRNGFVQIGECTNAGLGGSTFYDRGVKRGLRYAYRAYSVDIFGNKSEAPAQFEMFVADNQRLTVDIPSPSLLAEVDAATGKARVTFSCDDDRIVSLFLTRRDLTLRQGVFAPPGQVSAVKLGNKILTSRSSEGVRMFDLSPGVVWNGMFKNSGEQTVFIDGTVTIDHAYQYQLHGVDGFGNQTSAVTSDHLFIANRSMLSTPVSLSASLQQDARRAPTGVRLEWQPGDLDIASEDRLGDRTALSASIVRTLFQVQRRRLGESTWRDFPLSENAYFVDPIESSMTVAQGYRPVFLSLGEKYDYRVQAYRSGGFISNFSAPLRISVELPVLTPVVFSAVPADPKSRPFLVELGWNDDPTTGAIDRWEIQRAEVNNFAAARLNVKNPTEFANLDFQDFRTVYRESSRFQARTLDDPKAPAPFQHSFIDLQVSFGNSYFYRIRSVGVDGQSSGWMYRGVKIADDVSERRQNVMISSDERRQLASTFAPMLLPTKDSDALRSYSLSPTFSSPVRLPPSTLAKV